MNGENLKIIYGPSCLILQATKSKTKANVKYINSPIKHQKCVRLIQKKKKWEC